MESDHRLSCGVSCYILGLLLSFILPCLCARYCLGVEHPCPLFCLASIYSPLKTLLIYDHFGEDTGKCHLFYFQNIFKMQPPPCTSGIYPVARAPIVSSWDVCQAFCLPTVSVTVLFLKPTSAHSSFLLRGLPIVFRVKAEDFRLPTKRRKSWFPTASPSSLPAFVAPPLATLSSRQAHCCPPQPAPPGPLHWMFPLPGTLPCSRYPRGFFIFISWISLLGCHLIKGPLRLARVKREHSPLAFLSYLTGISYIP